MGRYLPRSIDNILLAWKKESKHKPLLLRGARQVGKSSAVKHLALEFDNYVDIIRKSKFPWFPERSVQFSGKRTKRSVQKKKAAHNTYKAGAKG